MSTFIGQLIGFAVIVFILMKWVVPLVRDMMHKQQDAIRTALTESAEAAKKLEDADAMHARAVEDAEAESAKVTDEARQDSSESPPSCRSRRASTPNGSKPKAHNRSICCGSRSSDSCVPASARGRCRRRPNSCVRMSPIPRPKPRPSTASSTTSTACRRRPQRSKPEHRSGCVPRVGRRWPRCRRSSTMSQAGCASRDSTRLPTNWLQWSHC